MWIIHLITKLLYLNEILPAAALGLNICCAWFLARSFLAIGLPILRELGAGAYWEEPPNLFGVRWKIVATAIKQKAEVFYGLSLLVLAAVCGFIALFMTLIPHDLILSFIIVTITIVLFIGAGQIIVPLLNYRFFVKAAKEALHTSPEYWLGIETDQRNEKIAEQVGLYDLRKFYEKHATKKLQQYLEKMDAMKNGKLAKRHIDNYGQLWNKKKFRK